MIDHNKIIHAEIMAGLQKKFYSLTEACNNNKLFAELDILRDIVKDLNRLADITTDRIELKRE